MRGFQTFSLVLLFTFPAGLVPDPVQATPAPAHDPSIAWTVSRQIAGPVPEPASPLAAGASAGGLFIEPLSLPITWAASQGPTGVAAADFNHDGIPDLAASHTSTLSDGHLGRVSVLLGQGLGQFSPPLTFRLPVSGTVVGYPTGILAKDFDGDGNPDLAVPAPEQKRIVLFKGFGDGTFSAGTGAPISLAPFELQSADLNADGALDLVAAGTVGTSALGVLLNNGNGTFGAAAVYSTTAAIFPQDIALGDLNGDNRPDLVIGTRSFTAGLGVRLNNGSGGFGPQTDFNFGYAISGLMLADFDGDGKRDVVAGGYRGDGIRSVAFLKGNGDGTFAPPAAQLPGIEPEALRAGSENVAVDVNGDGKQDVIFTHAPLNRLSVGLNDGAGGFTVVTYVASNGPPGDVGIDVAIEPQAQSVVAVDLTGDGRIDLAVAAAPGNGIAGTLGIIPGTAAGFASPRRAGYGPRSQGGLALGDMTGDGKLDIVSNVLQAGLQVRPGNGDGTFGAAIETAPAALATAGASGPIRLVDFDKDGNLDAATLGNKANAQGGLVAFGTGTGAFTSTQMLTFTFSSGLAGPNVLTGDVNGDGFQDVVARASSASGPGIQVEVWTYNGGSTRAFTRAYRFDLSSNGCIGAALGDFDGDGKLDLVTCVPGAPVGWQFVLMKGNGDGTFAEGVPFSGLLFGVASNHIAAADLNGDGKLDLLATVGGAPGNASPAETLVQTFLGNGNGTFQPPALYSSGFGLAFEVAVADFTGDSKLDLAVAHGINLFGNGMSVLPGNGDGSFGGAERFAVGAIRQDAVAAGDLNGDGRPDIVSNNGASSSGDHFAALINSGVNVPDLVPSSVNFPASAMPGDQVVLTYVVENQGLAFASGAWNDALFLSQDNTWDRNDLPLANLQHAGPLAPGSRYTETVTVSVPGVLPGPFRIIVHTDSRQRLVDADTINNRFTAPATFTVNDAPLLTLGVAVNGTLLPGQQRFFRVAGLPGRDLKLLATFGGPYVAEFLVRYALPPGVSSSDRAYPRLFDTSQTLLLPQTQGGVYYVLLRAREGAAGGKSFQLMATAPGSSIESVTPNRGSNLGNVTVTIAGAGLPLTSTAVLSANGTTRAATSTSVQDSTMAFATFDLTGLTPGVYDLTMDSIQIAGAFTVSSGPAGQLRLNIQAPATVRPNREQQVTVEYVNTGETDVVAPLLLVFAQNATLRFPEQEEYQGYVLEALGINKNGPAGILPPGGRGTIDLRAIPIEGGAHEVSKFGVSTVSQPGAARDFSRAKNDLRPPHVAADAWDAIFANFLASIGTTTGSYQARMAANATELGKLGAPTANVNKLQAFELMRADNFGAISARYQNGAFGRGSTDPGGPAIRQDAAGNVVVSLGGEYRLFTRQPSGDFLGMAGETAKLRQVNGTFRLDGTDGSFIQFRPDGRLDFIRDPAGNQVAFGYDAGGHLVSFTDPAGDTLTYGYNAQGKVAQITDPIGRTTTFGYDAAGEHLTSKTDAVGTTAFTYITGQGAAREHALASVSYPTGSRLDLEYDDRGRLTKRTLGDTVVTYRYEADGSIVVRNALGEETRIFVSGSGRAGRLVAPGGAEAAFRYDAAGRLIETTGSSGARAVRTYDALSNLVQAIDPLGGRVDLEFDQAIDRLTGFQDKRGKKTAYTYDSKGDLASVTLADGSTRGLVSDTRGRVTSSTDRAGQTTRYSYDTKDLLTRMDLPDGSRIDFVYDTRRNLISATQVNGVQSLATTFQYDSRDLLTRVTYPGGRFVSYGLDALGRTASLTDHLGNTVRYTYDTLSRLTEVTEDGAGLVVRYSYDAAGRMVHLERGNGTTSDYTYNTAGLLASIVHRTAGGEISRFEATYNTGGRVTRLMTPEGEQRYGYDPAGQLVSVDAPGRTIRYTYDLAGNRVTVVDGTTVNYVTNDLNQYTTAGATTFTYDLDGRMATRTAGGQTANYSYDPLGRLIKIEAPGSLSTFEYDALGDLLAATRDGQRTEYLTDPLGLEQIVAEFDGSGTLLARYIYGRGLASRVAPGQRAFYHFDGVGNTTELTDGAGNVLNRYRYLPFGERLSTTGTTPNPFTFGGALGVREEASGLYQMRMRWYDAAFGRFTSRDPAGPASDLNFYRYAFNAPTALVDPTGLAPAWVSTTESTQLAQALAECEHTAGFTIREIKQGDLAGNVRGTGRVYSNVKLLQGDASRIRGYLDQLDRIQPGMSNSAAPFSGVDNLRQHMEQGILSEADDLVNQTARQALHEEGLAEINKWIQDTPARNMKPPSNVKQWLGKGGEVLGRLGGPMTAYAAATDLNETGMTELFARATVTMQQDATTLNPFSEQAAERFRRGEGRANRKDTLGVYYDHDTFTFDADLEAGPPLPFELRPKDPSMDGRTTAIAWEIITSGDPNDIVGPIGRRPNIGAGFFGELDGVFALPYTIRFENMPTASAPAQVITITQTLDASLDPATFEFDAFGFGGTRYQIPAGRTSFEQRIPLTSTLEVRISAVFDSITSQVTLVFSSLDPLTGDLTGDPLAGLLPPNKTPPKGEGFVSYKVRLKSGLALGTRIDARARIFFDTNAPIDTPAIFNHFVPYSGFIPMSPRLAPPE